MHYLIEERYLFSCYKRELSQKHIGNHCFKAFMSQGISSLLRHRSLAAAVAVKSTTSTILKSCQNFLPIGAPSCIPAQTTIPWIFLSFPSLTKFRYRRMVRNVDSLRISQGTWYRKVLFLRLRPASLHNCGVQKF